MLTTPFAPPSLPVIPGSPRLSGIFTGTAEAEGYLIVNILI